MENVTDWLNARPASSRTVALLGLALAPLALLVAVGLTLPAAAPFVGAIAGAALFVACYGYWHTVLPADRQQATDLKAKYALAPRRGIVVDSLAVWIIVLLIAGAFLFGPLLGTLNVFVLITLYWVWRATPSEAAEAQARWEAAQVHAEAQSGARDDLDDLDGHDNL